MAAAKLWSRLPADLAAGEQWLFNRSGAESSFTPSMADGISANNEAHDRATAVYMIRALCRQLKLHEQTAASAALFLHRFYMVRSLKTYAWKEMVAPCVFLATKVEEELRRMRYIVGAWLAVQHYSANDTKCPDFPEDGEAWLRTRKSMLYHEEMLLVALNYDLSIEHPFTYILRGVELVYESNNLAQAFEGVDEAPHDALAERIEKLKKAAWSVAADSYFTNLCVLHPPKAIAAMAILLGSRMIREPLPLVQDTKHPGKPQPRSAIRVKKEWWSVFGVTPGVLEAGAAVIVARYALSTNAHILLEAKKLGTYTDQQLPNGLAQTPGTPPLPPQPAASMPKAEPTSALLAPRDTAKEPTQLEEPSRLLTPKPPADEVDAIPPLDESKPTSAERATLPEQPVGLPPPIEPAPSAPPNDAAKEPVVEAPVASTSAVTLESLSAPVDAPLPSEESPLPPVEAAQPVPALTEAVSAAPVGSIAPVASMDGDVVMQEAATEGPAPTGAPEPPDSSAMEVDQPAATAIPTVSQMPTPQLEAAAHADLEREEKERVAAGDAANEAARTV